MFSLIAAIFLPLSFLTGLLGINVPGISGADDPEAFLVFCGILIALTTKLPYVSYMQLFLPWLMAYGIPDTLITDYGTEWVAIVFVCHMLHRLLHSAGTFAWFCPRLSVRPKIQDKNRPPREGEK